MTSYTNVFGGSPVQPSDVSYRAISLTANTTLQWPFSFQDTANVTAHIMDVTPTANGYILTLPDATEASVGEDFLISNLAGSAYTFYIATVNSDGESSNIVTVDQGEVYYLYLRDNTISEGEWGLTLFGQGTTAVSSITLNTTTTNALTLNATTTATITSAGTITINVGNDLNALSNFGTGTGYAVRTSYNSSTGDVTWSMRTFTTDGNVTLTNPAGIQDGTIIGLNSQVKITGSSSVGSSTTYTTLTDTALYATSTTNSLTLGNSTATGPIYLVGGTTYGNLTLNASIAATPGTGGNLTLGSSGMTGTTTLYGPSSNSLAFTSGVVDLAVSTGSNITIGNSSTYAYVAPALTSGAASVEIASLGQILLSAGTNVSFDSSDLQDITQLTATTIINKQVAKAFAQITLSSSVATVNTQYNISTTVTRVSTGRYSIAFTTALGSNNYSVVFGNQSGAVTIVVPGVYSGTQLSTGFDVGVWAITTGSSVFSDDGTFYFAVFSNT